MRGQGAASAGASRLMEAVRVEYDLYYLRNWSLTFDLQIITLTCLRLFNSKNAY